MNAPHARRPARARWLPVLARWLPALAWMVVIFALSSVSGLRVSQEAEVDRPIRALAHLASYAFLAGLVLYALAGMHRPGRRDIVVAFLVTVLYGMSDEIHQGWVPDRSGRVEDVLIDAAGAAMGLLMAGSALARRSGRSGRRPWRVGGGS